MTSHRPPSDKVNNDPAPDEDPLVELARIVSEGDAYGRSPEAEAYQDYEAHYEPEAPQIAYQHPEEGEGEPLGYYEPAAEGVEGYPDAPLEHENPYSPAESVGYGQEATYAEPVEEDEYAMHPSEQYAPVEGEEFDYSAGQGGYAAPEYQTDHSEGYEEQPAEEQLSFAEVGLEPGAPPIVEPEAPHQEFDQDGVQEVIEQSNQYDEHDFTAAVTDNYFHVPQDAVAPSPDLATNELVDYSPSSGDQNAEDTASASEEAAPVNIDLANFEAELLGIAQEDIRERANTLPPAVPLPPSSLPKVDPIGKAVPDRTDAEVAKELERFNPTKTQADQTPRKGPDLSEIEDSLRENQPVPSLDDIDLETGRIRKANTNPFDEALEGAVTRAASQDEAPKAAPLPESYKEPLPPTSPAVYATYPIPGQHDEETGSSIFARLTGGSMKALLAILVVGLFVIFGGIGLVFFTGGNQQTPSEIAIIRADEGSFKEYPEVQPSQETDVANRVFDRVEGESLVASSDDPASQSSTIDRIVGQNDDELQITLPVNSQDVQESEAPGLPGVRGGTDVANDSSGVAPTTPRGVRVVVVRPDGTIIREGETQLNDGADTIAQSSLSLPDTDRIVPLPTAESSTAAQASAEQAVSTQQQASSQVATDNNDRLSNDAIVQEPAQQETAPINSAALESTAPTAVAPQPAETARTTIPLPALLPRPRPSVAPTASAAANQTVVALPPSQPATAPTTAPAVVAGTGTHGIQLSAQRSREAAESTFQRLQNRYPSVLGGLTPVYEVANISTGTWYRVSVGPVGDSNAANTLCNALKAQGGDCFVKRF